MTSDQIGALYVTKLTHMQENLRQSCLPALPHLDPPGLADGLLIGLLGVDLPEQRRLRVLHAPRVVRLHRGELGGGAAAGVWQERGEQVTDH